jgi:Ca2+-binding EF-hand superfamily protein
MSSNFGDYSTNISLEMYATGLESLFGQDEDGLRKFAFKIFDVNNDKKVSEYDMFELMGMASHIKGGYYQ